MKALMSNFDYEDFDLEIYIPGNDSEFEFYLDRLMIDEKTSK